MKHRQIGAVFGMLLPIAAWSQDNWVNDKTVQQQLAAGQVAVRIVYDGDDSRVRVDAAVKIKGYLAFYGSRVDRIDETS